ncbi:MAG: prolyl oligopeptidase family serine peptidase [Planctomycetaceae bacterium]|nr:prolyl oligopeptidase family serine peptidase [Planctomycetaceae bacterium]
MINRFLVLSAIITLYLSGYCSAEDKPGMQQDVQLDRPITIKMGYLLYLPEQYEQQEKWPLLVFLHGAGERGNNLEQVKKHGPPKLIAAGKQFPFIVASPQCPDRGWWEPVALEALIDELCEKHKVDQDRIYITGLSMGGFGTWRLAAYMPDRLAAIAPICGGGVPYLAREFSKLPTWAFHGAKDSVIPVEQSEVMVNALKNLGGNARLTVYPEANHDSWTETYDNPELYEWLLKQKRH